MNTKACVVEERKEDDPSRPASDDGDPGRPAGANTSAAAPSPPAAAGPKSDPEGPAKGRQETTGSDDPVGGDAVDGD
jgi:hypothetical protein